ncbi:hypothetical protein SODALDRAFT_326351 [Sodiomyces alkalinus F11]|uniref:Uncharacterized protein n=1 Tax=Sodiomyces alkalinus (strain CBS 110278 / VKM F-3762 / F11) TaxID=1314773 RepID=A0A3N2Q617_SODAK|nr:hypothetical protein SODALDRAFT_326351 [Sodiomyces alkalinus F11]ROT42180.1 hypothetical protein SODALDRAFT_326351 [Sodiomyces alkalinus F11]
MYHHRIAELAHQWGIVLPPAPSPLTRPSHPPTFRNADDDFHAEELVKRRQLSHGRTESTGNLRKAFSSKKKAYDPRLVFDALNSHVAHCGRPGVAESLIKLLLASGGDVNLPQKPKTGLLSRRRSLETLGERSRLLQQAVTNNQPDMVAVLLPHADAVALDTSLPIAIQERNPDIVELLLRYGAGAGAASTADGQDAFRDLCASGGQPQLVSLLLRSGGRPSVSWLSQCMIDAVRAGCLGTVLHLSRSAADGNLNQGEALNTAILHSRHDIVLAIIAGINPPQGQVLNEAFAQLMGHASMNPNEKARAAELLLCAGPHGDSTALALLDAATTESLEMVHVLVAHGASIAYRDALALRKAISNGRVDVAQIMLSGKSPLSSIQASECVGLIPRHMGRDHGHLLLDLLLRRGASGNPLHEKLIGSAEDGDVGSVALLLSPQSHEVASVDYKGGLALQIAVRRCDVPMTRQMLASNLSSDTMTSVFHETKTLPPSDRLNIAECFLDKGLPETTVQEALQEAISEKPPQRDENLIALLLKYTTDVKSSAGPLAAAVQQKDINLLAALLQKNVSPQTAVEILPTVVTTVVDPRARLEMTSLILSSVPGTDPAKISLALIHVLELKPPDMRLLQVLLHQGRADINSNEGLVVATAIRNHDPPVLDMLLKQGNPSPATTRRGLSELSHLPSCEKKAAKLQTLLRYTKETALLDDILVKEVHSLIHTSPENRNPCIIKVLLLSGANVNAHNAAALCHAVSAADAHLTDLLCAAKPNAAALAYALPHALRIADAMDRLTFAKKLLDAGAPSAEANRALGFAIKTYTDDMPLLRTLSKKADTADGEALLAAVRRERPDILELVLQRMHPSSAVNTAFAEAIKSHDKELRALMCTLLLKHGASGAVASDALRAAAADGDLVLGNLLVSHGVGVDEQAVIQACRSGAADVLAMLLSGDKNHASIVDEKTLGRGFQAATEVGDLKKRAAVLAPLLARGVGGDALNGQLVSAVRFGADGEDLVRILLRAGADPNYYNGEAVWAATQSAYLGSLEMMLGTAHAGDTDHPKPTAATLKRALQASGKLGARPRLDVVEMLFQAGLSVCEELHIALNKAVNEEVPDEKLIEAFVRHGASPLPRGRRTLVDAANRCSPSIVSLLLEAADVSGDDVSLVIRQSFTKDTAGTWFDEQGFLVLQSMLDKGARGEGISSVLALVLDMASDGERPELANRFIDLLSAHDVDVDYQDGKLLISATSACDVVLIKRLLEKKPRAETLSRAFYRVFDTALAEDDALQLISLFTEYGDGETRLDVMYTMPGISPILFLALAQYPRSTRVVRTLLDAGFYHDQMTVFHVAPGLEEDEEETVTLLTWSLLQPQKKISSNVIHVLVEAGAKVNVETRVSRVTPLMAAIQARRPDIVKRLLLEGAEVDVADAGGDTPLAMATDIGGELAITIMSSLLAAGASRDDGSLHNAARELNLPAVQVLVEYGHDPDFPSHLHDGRSALGELCLRAADSSEFTAAREKTAEKVMGFLIEKGSDMTLKVAGKSILHLALESRDPLTTTRLLLKCGMWKHVNRKFNLYTDGGGGGHTYTYSPTMYVAKALPASEVRDPLVALLRANRGEDVYYANAGPQPDDAAGLPDDLALQERERRARLARLAHEQEDHERSLARTRSLAAVQAQIWTHQAELEDGRRRRTQGEEMAAMGERARAEEAGFLAAMRLRQEERAAEAAHQRTLTAAATARTRQEVEMEGRRQAQGIEWERKMAAERVEHAKAMSALRVSEREDVDRMDREQNERVNRRITEQRRLVESQSGLAGQLAGVGANGRRQIGYISGELS